MIEYILEVKVLWIDEQELNLSFFKNYAFKNIYTKIKVIYIYMNLCLVMMLLSRLKN